MFEWEGKYFIVYRNREFWTGFNWVDVVQFAKPYEFTDALTILEKRFHRMLPKPVLMRCEIYKEKERRAAMKLSRSKL